MAEISVICQDGARRPVSGESINCPGCGSFVLPLYLYNDHPNGVLFCQCPVTNCSTYFILRQTGYGCRIMPNHPQKKEVFSAIINTISPRFCKIFNESYAAEQMSLMEVCGVGYRKAVEFLIKDYIIEGKDEETQERIKMIPLAQCIETYVTDGNVKSVSKRAVWLGNDETHYVRKWEEKDVKDLKGLIKLTIRWIEQEKETKALLEEMPEGR